MDEQHTRTCRFCMGPIHVDAKICPACLSRQTRSVFESAGRILKWFGGITAVVSLIIGVIQISSLVRSWSERRQAVEELVQASYLRDMAGDFQAAWQLMEDALVLDPSSALARKKQVFLAMKWLRHMSFKNINDGEADRVTRSFLPILYRGAVSPDPLFSADILAHIGLAGFIQRKEQRIYQIDPLTHYEQALEKDPANVYAHTLMGQWILYSQPRKGCRPVVLDQALHHFSTALATQKEHHYVQEAKFSSLLACGIPGRAMALREANAIRLTKIGLDLDIRLTLIRLYKPLWYMGDPSGQWKEEIKSILEALSLADLLDTYVWLNHGVDYEKTCPSDYNKSDHRVILIRLKKMMEHPPSS